MKSELDALKERLENAQAHPPEVRQPSRKVLVPEVMRPSTDSRGHARPQMHNAGKERKQIIESTKREMLAGARTELVIRAREQLK